jgi:hypothetical protein
MPQYPDMDLLTPWWDVIGELRGERYPPAPRPRQGNFL